MAFSVNHFSFRSGCALISYCIFVFFANGSFKACGVLFNDAVVLYNTSNFFAGWAFCFQPSVTLIVAGISSLLTKDFSYRAAGMFGGFLFGLGFTCLGIFGQNVLQLFLFTGTTAFGSGILSFVCYMALVEHFTHNFGVYFSIREVFSFLGITVMPPLVEVLRSNYGFHGGYLLLGAVTWNSMLCGVLLQPVVASPQKARKTDFVDENGGRTVSKLTLGGKNTEHINIAPIMGFSSLIKHPQFTLYAMIQSLFDCEFAVWAVFLVPYGKSLGFNADVAVYLSTAGGIGGLMGKITSLVVFYFDKMDVLTLSMLPAVLCTVSLIGYMFITNYVPLLLFSSLFGFALAFQESALSATTPKMLCNYHLRQGLLLNYILSGLSVQVAGISTGKPSRISS